MEQAVMKMPNEKYCTQCGGAIASMAEICPRCGVRQMAPPDSKNKIIAAVFAFFLGAFGVHKFYLHKPGQGILYILFCWTLIPSIISFIEGVRYLLMSDAAFAAQYH